MGFLSDLWAATPENPRFSLNDPAAWDALGAQPSSAGVQVNEETALTHSPWWRGVNLLANDVAKLKLQTWTVKKSSKELAKKHPAYMLLRWRPNECQTAGVWRKQMMGQVLSRGNAYSYIMRNGAGDPYEILPLNPYDTYPARENGKLWYVTRVHDGSLPGGGEDRKLAAEDVLHFKGLGFDGLQGYPVIDKARETLGLGLGERKHQSIFFRNSARPSIILMHPGVLGDKTKEELRSSWERMQSGLENAHRTAILDRGLTAKDISFNAVDSQLLESRRFDIIDVANYIGVPPHKLGGSSNTSYGSLEQENQAYLDSGLDPWLCAIEEECREKLLRESEKDDESVEILFDRGGLVQANRTDRANAHRIELAGQPYRTVEEVRLEEGYSPEPEIGEIKTPLNMGKLGGDPDAPGNGPPKPGQPPNKPAPALPVDPTPLKKPKKSATLARLRFAAGLMLLDAATRGVKRIGLHAERAASKGGKEFRAWVESFEAVHEEALEEIFGPALVAARALRLEGVHPTSSLLARMRSEYEALIDRATASSLAADAKALVADQFVRLPPTLVPAPFAFDPDQPRDDSGKFGNGGGKPQRDQEDKDREAKRDAEDKDAQRQRDKEEDGRQRGRDKEDKEVERGRDKEDDKLQGKRDKEDAKIEKSRDKEDDKRSAGRDKEDEAHAEREGGEEDALIERQGKEQEEQSDRHDAEREAADGTPDEEPTAVRHASEQKDMADRHDREEKEMKDRHAARQAGTDADREKEDKETIGRREAEDGVQSDARDKEDAAIQEGRDNEDAAREAGRGAEDDAHQQRRDAEDDARDKGRSDEDDAIQGQRDAEDDADDQTGAKRYPVAPYAGRKGKVVAASKPPPQPQPPPIIVNVAPPAVTINNAVNVPEQPAPVVNVANAINVPEQRPQEPPVVNNIFNVPEQPAPTVTVDNIVNVPEQPAPAVTVNMPPRTLTIERGRDGKMTGGKVE